MSPSYAEPKQRKGQNSKEIQIESNITMPIVLTDNTWTTSIVNKVIDDCNDNMEPTCDSSTMPTHVNMLTNCP